MSKKNLSLEEFKEYLFYPDSYVWPDVSDDQPVNTTIPNENTDFIEWAYENRKWIPAIGGVDRLKSYFLSLIYTPYDDEMVDITEQFVIPPSSDECFSLHTYDSDMIQLFLSIMKHMYLQQGNDSADDSVSADMEVD